MKKILMISLTFILLFTAASCSSVKDIDAQNSIIHDLIEKFENEKEENRLQLEKLKEQIVDLTKQVSDLELTIINQNEQISNLSTILVSLQDKLVQLETSNDENANDINELNIMINTLKSTISNLEADNLLKNDAIKDLLNKYNELIFELNLSEFGVELFSFDDNTLTKEFSFINKYGLEYSSIKYEINHPFTKETSTFSGIISTGIIEDMNTNRIPIEFPHHGYFEIHFEVSFIDIKGNTVKKDYVEQIFVSDSHYNLAWLHATQPVLLFASDLFYGVYDEGTTYVEIQRASTYDFDKLPENALKYPISVSPTKGNYNQSIVHGFFDNVNADKSNLMIKWMEELHYVNRESTFTIIGVDNLIEVVASSLISRIPIEKKSFKLYTDGTYTNTLIRDYYQSISKINDLKDMFLDKYNDYINGSYTSWYLWEAYTIAASHLDNFEVIVNNLDSLVENPDTLTYLKSEFNIRTMTVQEAFERLKTKNKLKDLEFLLKTRWGDLEEESMNSFFSGKPEKNLLILGTSNAGENNKLYASFDKYFEFIIKNYSDEYKVFYKGHPKYPSSSDRAKMFEDNSVLELPNSIPVETLMLLYPNVYVGGYSGTSFQSSLENQTVFFFGTKNSVSNNAVIKEMMLKGIFDGTVFLTVDDDGEVLVTN